MITSQPLHDPGGILKIPLCTYTKCVSLSYRDMQTLEHGEEIWLLL